MKTPKIISGPAAFLKHMAMTREQRATVVLRKSCVARMDTLERDLADIRDRFDRIKARLSAIGIR